MPNSTIIADSRHFLLPSDLLVPTEQTLVTTLLGSCIAICLYDPIRNAGGINHFMLPTWNGQEQDELRYGDASFHHLLEQMVRSGTRVRDLKAKVFGGANQQGASSTVGRENTRLAISLLEKQHIELLAQSTGGVQGRKITFNTGTGEVRMWYPNKTEYHHHHTNPLTN